MPKAEVIRIKRICVGGQYLLDIRRYRKDGDGELKPTKRGLSLPIRLKDQVANIMKDSELDSIDITL